MTKILVPVSTTEDAVSFVDEARRNCLKGKISYEQFCNIEMLELGYNPSSPKEKEEYFQFIESLQDADNFNSNAIFTPVEISNSNENFHVECESCGAIHIVQHLEWSAIICCHCASEIYNPYDKEF